MDNGSVVLYLAIVVAYNKWVASISWITLAKYNSYGIQFSTGRTARALFEIKRLVVRSPFRMPHVDYVLDLRHVGPRDLLPGPVIVTVVVRNLSYSWRLLLRPPTCVLPSVCVSVWPASALFTVCSLVITAILGCQVLIELFLRKLSPE